MNHTLNKEYFLLYVNKTPLKQTGKISKGGGEEPRR
jgi:hypothetical protein